MTENNCPLCKETGYSPHHPQCPNRRRERKALCPSDVTACSVAVLLKPREIAALDGLCAQKDMTRQGVMLASLRLYQAVALGAAEVTWKFTGPVGCMGDDCPPNLFWSDLTTNQHRQTK
jgi:hypothetical protein